MSEAISIESMLDFWFSDYVRKHWFNSTLEFDQEIIHNFDKTYLLAQEGKLVDWATSPLGCVALVILFDQIPLHMYRGQKQSFASEEKSRAVATQAIKCSFDQNLSEPQKMFLYMPYMHSEKIADQLTAIELYEKADLKENLKFAKHHYDIVKRFGRFPHRNAILARENTADEQVYLDSDEAFLG